MIPDGKRIVAEGDGAATTFTIKNDFPESRRVVRPEHVIVEIESPAGDRRLRRGAGYSLAGLGESDVTVTLKQPLAVGERVVITAGRSLVGANGLFGGAENAEIALAPSVTLKVVGNQWNWTYAYPDFGDFDFISNMMPKEKTTPALYRFEVDNRVVVPVGETVRVTTTGSDVIHSWALPNFGIKIDAVPGRINETWFKADREGVYYGQCSEICGVKHSAMPIGVEVVSREAFCNWVRARQSEYGIERTEEQRRAEPVCGAMMPAAVAAADTSLTFAEAESAQSEQTPAAAEPAKVN
ncbi:MAG: cytochrome c oxidase subunit II [Parvularculaceae bacterium]|nr:cytochrome c oxidase subunit II [Parvularculaceae bacterium]